MTKELPKELFNKVLAHIKTIISGPSYISGVWHGAEFMHSLLTPSSSVQDVVICVCCKSFFYKGVTQCHCGGKTFEPTHPSNIPGSVQERAKEWELKCHSYQIADTGDYDGYWEITNGKISIFSKDDEEDQLLEVVNSLNESGCKFYLDTNDIDFLKAENEWLKNDLAGASGDGMQEEVERLKAELELTRQEWAEKKLLLEKQVEVTVQYQMERDMLREALEECKEYFDNKADVDLVSGHITPNKEAKLLSTINEVLK